MRSDISESQQMRMGQPGSDIPSTIDSDEEDDQNYVQDNFRSLSDEKEIENKYRM